VLMALLLVLMALLLGGDMIHYFSIALILGVVVGTFSSIYVAAALLLAVHLQREDLIPPKKEDAEAEEELP
jgi:preprotein translocase subunit SecF